MKRVTSIYWRWTNTIDENAREANDSFRLLRIDFLTTDKILTRYIIQGAVKLKRIVVNVIFRFGDQQPDQGKSFRTRKELLIKLNFSRL